jgi:hypothetical protein
MGWFGSGQGQVGSSCESASQCWDSVEWRAMRVPRSVGQPAAVPNGAVALAGRLNGTGRCKGHRGKATGSETLSACPAPTQSRCLSDVITAIRLSVRHAECQGHEHLERDQSASGPSVLGIQRRLHYRRHVK